MLFFFNIKSKLIYYNKVTTIMNFRYELNNQINQLPDHIRRNERVKTYARMVIGSFETMLAVFGPNVLDIDINWNHLIGQIAAIRHVEQDNWPQHIDYFNLDNYQANDTHSEEHNENNEQERPSAHHP